MMLRQGGRFAGIVLIALFLAGCSPKLAKDLHYLGDADLNYYKDQATQVAYAHEHEPVPDEVTRTDRPRLLNDRRHDEIWDMTLTEAIHTALANNRIIRTNNEFLATTVNNQSPSIYDSAIQETGVLFGGRGVEAALADFDAQFSTSMIWGRDEQIQNGVFNGVPGGTLVTETGFFDSAISKQFANGDTFSVSHAWDYLGTNQQGVMFPSAYRGNVQAQYRHPLLAGSGSEFTRIAGPINPNFGAITGVSQGVLIARINNDITLAQFENSVRNMLLDVEVVYWDLYLAYRNWDTAVAARNSALRTWRDAKARLDVGGSANFEPADEAQARDQYFATRASAETAQSRVYSTEVRLRRLIGLPVNDGRIIRPVDEPTSAQFVPDWYTSLTEAMTERVELRQQKWTIKSFELQLLAARSLTKPRLDFVSSYNVNGFGDELIDYNDNDGITPAGAESAYGTLTNGDQTGWTMGLQFSMPIGFRQALAQVRNYELRLTKAREVLAVLEQDISHELATAFQELALQYQTAATNFDRVRAARQRVELFQAKVDRGVLTYDELLRAQASLADAEVAYFTSLVGYNQAIADVHFRKGTILTHNNVFLAEGEWVPNAYDDAKRRADARSHALPADWMLHSKPPEFASPYPTSQIKIGAPEVAQPAGEQAPQPPAEPAPTIPYEEAPPPVEAPRNEPPPPPPAAPPAAQLNGAPALLGPPPQASSPGFGWTTN